jgi:outer membrane protein TolC
MIRLVIAAAAFALVVTSAAADEKTEPSQEKIKSLQKQRVSALKYVVKARETGFVAGKVTLETLLGFSEKLLKAELDLETGKEQRLGAYAAHRDRTRKAFELMKERFKNKEAPLSDVEVARAAYLEAEIGWLKAGGKEKEEKDK